MKSLDFALYLVGDGRSFKEGMTSQDLHVRKVPLATGVEGMILKQGDQWQCIAIVRHKK